MSLLWMEYEKEFQDLTESSFLHEQRDNAEYFASLNKRVHKIIYRDTRYNVDFLYTSYILGEDKIMEDYAAWLYQLMASVFKGRRTADQTKEYVIAHFNEIRKGIQDTIEPEKRAELFRLLNVACESVRKVNPEIQTDVSKAGDVPPFSRYESQVQQYLDSLFKKDMRKSMELIQQFTEQGIPVNDIYVEILAESMRRIGELWHTAQISVDAEHYCTSVTQMAMAQMYPLLFARQRKNRKILCACPGMELHEMGSRMVADLFENDGWDSIFLGAAVPEDALLKSIEENQPDLVALSVSMPQHLITCQEFAESIREQFPNVKIAVGGKAFKSTHNIWKQWPVDVYTNDARELLEYANGVFEDKE